MKKILGLDLGVGSIGWSAICVDDDNKPIEILGMGSRVVPLSTDETTGFTKGNGESVCSQRTTYRSLHRGIARFQQRRKRVRIVLEKYGITYSPELLRLDPGELWELRARAAAGEKVELPGLARIILHINARRGYRHAKEEINDKKQSEYLARMNDRAREAEHAGLTPGQYFFERLQDSVLSTPRGKAYTYRVRNQVFPRKSYEEELHKILIAQQKFYPAVLTEEAIDEIEIAVFTQRPLRSCKHLVSLCEFESHEIDTPKGKKIIGPRVAPRTSPLYQVERLWEAINNIVLYNHANRRRKKDYDMPSLFGDDRRFCYEYHLTDKERYAIFDFLNCHDQLKGSDLLKILGLKKDDGFTIPAQVVKGLKGNTTRMALAKALDGVPDAERLLAFDLQFEESDRIDPETGEVLMRVSSDYLRQPLYQLWHTIYSVSGRDELSKALASKFGITDERTVDALFGIDFRAPGYGDKSARFICRLIPYLEREGLHYSEACERVGVRHSESLSKEENAMRPLIDRMPLIAKGQLRQPVVEKILNQMINLVNAAMERYGRFDEIRVELARELQRSKEQRKQDSDRNSLREKENSAIKARIAELGLRPSANKIQKFRMWEEAGHCCMYCGQPVALKEFLLGIDAEKEHIIPRSIFFDDSFSNKVCSYRNCNHAKGQATGYDFKEAQGEEELLRYIDRVEQLHQSYKASKGRAGISKTKHDRLLTSRSQIPTDFVNRDLRLTQYISRKALELLRAVCLNPCATSGGITSFFRHAWGYDDILHNLNLRRYSAAGQTEYVSYEHRGQVHAEERIANWSKRLDHRHHAIDALVIALTRQAYIHRLNTLNAQKTEEACANIQENLDKWAAACPHFSTAAVQYAADKIAVSFKSGKRLVTPGKRYVGHSGKRKCVQEHLLVPRGALTEETIYGINRKRSEPRKLKYLFENPADICSPAIRAAVEKRLAEHGYDARAAERSCRKQPLRAGEKDSPIEQAEMWEHDFVIRYPLSKITSKNVHDIIDGAVQKVVEERFAAVGGSDKAFQQSLASEPLLHPGGLRSEIKAVRCGTGLRPSSMTKVGRGYAKYGNNHHISLYEDKDGNLQECVVPFAVAVERRRLGLPVVVEDPEALWDTINNLGIELPDDFLARFPLPGWRHVVSMQVNDMFIVGLTDEDITTAAASGDTHTLARHLYRIQKLSSWYFDFKLHTSTLADTTNEQMANGNYIRVTSGGRWAAVNPVKVKVDNLGRIHLPTAYMHK